MAASRTSAGCSPMGPERSSILNQHRYASRYFVSTPLKRASAPTHRPRPARTDPCGADRPRPRAVQDHAGRVWQHPRILQPAVHPRATAHVRRDPAGHHAASARTARRALGGRARTPGLPAQPAPTKTPPSSALPRPTSPGTQTLWPTPPRALRPAARSYRPPAT